MEIWLDTADLQLIGQAKEMGILDGVTLNPSTAAKSGYGLEELLEKILQLQKGPVTAQVVAEDAAAMIRQGKALAGLSNRIIVKVPVTGEGLKAIHALKEGKIPVMATAVFDPNQTLLAARAGADYIAPYVSAICEEGPEGIEELRAMLRLLDRYRFKSKLIAASLRSGEQVRQCAEMGAHAATLNPDVFKSFIEDHPDTVKTQRRFSKDWKGAKPSKTLL